MFALSVLALRQIPLFVWVSVNEQKWFRGPADWTLGSSPIDNGLTPAERQYCPISWLDLILSLPTLGRRGEC